MIEAVIPARVLTRDSLELSVCRNIHLNRKKVMAAITTPAMEEIGALTQTGEPIFVKMMPQAPKAVTNEESTVGLKNEIPGTPL